MKNTKKAQGQFEKVRGIAGYLSKNAQPEDQIPEEKTEVDPTSVYNQKMPKMNPKPKAFKFRK